VKYNGGAKDTPSWHFNKKGVFSVKSLYQVVLDNQARDSIHGLASTSNDYEQSRSMPWKKLWMLLLPSKVLHFLWRLAHNSLPLRMKLKSRGLEVDTRCLVCYRLDQDGGHCFLKCKCVKVVWRAALLEECRLELINCPRAISVLEDILKMEETKCLKVCILLWLWWSERNKANQGEKIRTTDEIIYLLQLHMMEHKDYNKPKKRLLML
jgi:hypothetical protein